MRADSDTPVRLSGAVSLATALAMAICSAPALAQLQSRTQSAVPALESLSETVERPLFLPDRRPPAIDEPAGEVDDAESGLFTLVGIIVSPTRRIALVRIRGSNEVLQLSEGQQANGWTVAQILPNEVIFESNDKTETIELIDISPPAQRGPSARERRSQPAQRDANRPPAPPKTPAMPGRN